MHGIILVDSKPSEPVFNIDGRTVSYRKVHFLDLHYFQYLCAITTSIFKLGSLNGAVYILTLLLPAAKTQFYDNAVGTEITIFLTYRIYNRKMGRFFFIFSFEAETWYQAQLITKE